MKIIVSKMFVFCMAFQSCMFASDSQGNDALLSAPRKIYETRKAYVARVMQENDCSRADLKLSENTKDKVLDLAFKHWMAKIQKSNVFNVETVKDCFKQKDNWEVFIFQKNKNEQDFIILWMSKICQYNQLISATKERAE